MASTWTYWPPDNARYAGDIWSTAVRCGVRDSDLTERASNCLVCRAGDAADTGYVDTSPIGGGNLLVTIYFIHTCVTQALLAIISDIMISARPSICH